MEPKSEAPLQLPRPVVEQSPQSQNGQSQEVAPAANPEKAASTEGVGQGMPAAAPPMLSSLPAIPLPAAQPPVAGQASSQSNGLQASDDSDLIEKEWVTKAKQIVERTRDDPYKQSEELTVFKADYMKKRYDKVIKVNK